MKYKLYITLALLVLFFCAGSIVSPAYAQKKESAADAGRLVTGTVVDEFNQPMGGVVVSSSNGKNEVVTTLDGVYRMMINDGSESVVVSFPGYKNYRLRVDYDNAMDAKMAFDAHRTDETIHLGYTSQSRNSITGAVSTVLGTQLEKVPMANFSQKLDGMLPGMTYFQESFSPSNESSWALIRGLSSINGRTPVTIIDGVLCPNSEFEYLTAQEIESVTILKDASATAIYGMQGANGVIVITTKRGHSGDLKVRVSVDNSFQRQTRRPDHLSSAEYARMRNQAGVNDGLPAYSQFTQAEIDKFASPADRALYPDNDWLRMFTKDYSHMQRVNVNVSGGNDKVRYFSNIGFMRQSSPFKIAETEKFDPTPSNMRINFRSNLDFVLNKYLDGFMSISGNIGRDKTAGDTNENIYRSIFYLPPTLYGPITPYKDHPSIPGEKIGGDVTTIQHVQFPTYGMLNRKGYGIRQSANIITQGGLKLNMDFLTKGLSLTGTMGYQTNAANYTTNFREYERYLRDRDFTQLAFVKRGAETNDPLRYNKDRYSFYNINLVSKLNYARTFGKHSVDAMGYVFFMHEEKPDWGAAGPAGMLPYRRQNLGVTALYGYDNRLYAKVDMGYSGSDQFARDKRFVATPAVSAAWVVSNEEFAKDFAWLSNLKVRASYGITANDELGTNQRFLYLDDFRPENGFDGLRGNPNLTAETFKRQNYGIDLGLFNSLSVSFDYYRSRTDDMLVGAFGAVPEYQGINLNNYPKQNMGEMESSGFEVSIDYIKKLNRDITVFAGVAVSQNTNKMININESELPEGYAYKYRNTGYGAWQQWGYQVDKSNGNGYFNTPAELAAAPAYGFGTPRLGDLIYKDMNGDNIIDEKDMAPIGNTELPKYYFSLSGGMSYRNFDFSFMLQGQTKVSQVMDSYGFYEFDYDGIFNDIHKNAWTPERFAAGQQITAPAVSLTRTTSHQPNTYYLMDRSYLRLKNVELGYTLPLSVSKAISAQKIRFTVQAQNLFTFDKMISDYIDPQAKGLNVFQPYRVFCVGANLTF